MPQKLSELNGDKGLCFTGPIIMPLFLERAKLWHKIYALISFILLEIKKFRTTKQQTSKLRLRSHFYCLMFDTLPLCY